MHFYVSLSENGIKQEKVGKMKDLFMKISETTDASVVGGKSYMMGRLVAVSPYTPDGMAVTTQMMREFLNCLNITDDEISAALHLEKQAIEKVQDVLQNGVWPAAVRDVLRKVYDAVESPVCVRSSAVSEDGRQHSFAGVYRSNINIRTFGEFLWAVRDCWMSAVDPNAVAYAEAVGENLTLMALTVQPLVHSIKSGVAVIDGGELTISAAYGQGHGVVAGQVSSDTYKIASDLSPVSETITRKENLYLDNIEQRCMCCEWMSRHWDDGHVQSFYISQTDERNAMLFCQMFPDEFGMPDKPVLTEEQRQRLAKELFRIAGLLEGSNWDFEWAFDEHNNLYILQARPLLSTLHTETPSQSAGSDRNVIAYGVPISAGTVSGKVRIIYEDKDIAKVEKGDLVAIDWIPESCIGVLNTAGGLIIGDNSVLSHCAIIAREWGIPCVGGIDKKMLVEERVYTINGATGTVSLDESAGANAPGQDKPEEQKEETSLSLLFWLVVSLDDLLTGTAEREQVRAELDRIFRRYPALETVDMTGISENRFGFGNADAVYKELITVACEEAASRGIRIITDAGSKGLIPESCGCQIKAV